MREIQKSLVAQKRGVIPWVDILQAVQSIFYLPEWHAQRRHKRDDKLWLFGAWSGERYSDNSRALYEYVLQNIPAIHCVWITRNEHVYQRLRAEEKPVELCDSNRGKQLQKDAGYFFWTANRYDGDFRFLNGAKLINLWHGVPIKKICADASVKQKSWFKRLKTSIRKKLMPWEFLQSDTVCGSSFFEPFLCSAFTIPKQRIIPFPEPRLDYLMSGEKEKLVKDIKNKYSNATIVLYMPTFRDNNLESFNPFALPDYNAERIGRMLEEQNIVLLYKGHFLDKTQSIVSNSERIMTISDDDYDNLYCVLKDVDILLTDYSSVYFDFIYLRKPMILFPFDYDLYMQTSREFYFDYKLMEAKKVYTWTELEECLRNKTYYMPSDEEIQRFRPLPIGNSSRQITEYLLKNIK